MSERGGLEYLLAGDASALDCSSVSAWWAHHAARCAQYASTIETAVAGGFAADRLAWAFCAGYQAALRALVPVLPADALASFCVSEAAGNHPRAIQSRIRPDPDRAGQFILDGHKRWTSLGQDSSLLLVAARVEGMAPSERIPLKLAMVRSAAPGVTLRPMSEIDFIPEVAHAEVQFERVSIAARDLLEGDGYARYVKPFRTLEDLHVHAAVLAYLLREARRLQWPRAWMERALANLYALCAIAPQDPLSPAMHIALAGALAAGAALIDESGSLWETAAGDAASKRWQRDRALLSVAHAAREQRLARAWETIG